MGKQTEIKGIRYKVVKDYLFSKTTTDIAMKNNRMKWMGIITFSILAIGLSAPFHLNVIDFGKPKENSALHNFMYSLHGVGPFLSALICLFIFKNSHVQTITIFGRKPRIIWLAYLLTLTIGAVIGLEVTFIKNRHWAGLYAVSFTMVYCFFEEFGWRGFLQDALQSFSKKTKYIVIGVVWYCWHLSFWDANSFVSEAVFFLILLVSSWAIGQAVERTKSVAIATYLHFIINFLFLGGLFRQDFNSKLIMTGVFVLIVALTIIYWPKISFTNRTTDIINDKVDKNIRQKLL
jgi:membrane protease YdiL (CAAX protease family)